MRKTSAYARKRKHTLKTNGDIVAHRVRQLNALSLMTARCMPYEGNSRFNSVDIMVKLRMTLQAFLDRTVPHDDTDLHDQLIIAIGVAKARYLEIGGWVDNPESDALDDALRALERLRDRWKRIGEWGLDGPAIQELKVGVELYERVLLVSSPQQMADAASVFCQWLKQDMKNEAQN